MSSSKWHQQARREADESELRAGVLRLGAMLGWDASVVRRFAEAVTGRDCNNCGRGELLDVLAAYAAIAHRVRVAQASLPGASGASGGLRKAGFEHHSTFAVVAHDNRAW
jgi:hypothetical protein